MSVTPPHRRHRAAATVDDLPTLTEDWLRRYGSPDTRRKYRAYMQLFVGWLERYEGITEWHVVTDVTTEECENYFTDLQSPHWDEHPGECTVECEQLKEGPYRLPGLKAKKAAISSFYAYAMKRPEKTGRQSNPTATLDFGSSARHERFVLTPDELDALVECARADSFRSAAIIGMTFGAGLRRNELYGVRIENFRDTPNGRRLTFHRKGGESRVETIDIPHAIVPDLDRYLKNSGDRTTGPLILSRQGMSLYPTKIHAEVQRLGCKAGVSSNLGPHDGKATATSYSLRDPAKPETRRVQLHFGHRSEIVTMSYYHPSRLPTGHLKNPIGLDWENQGFNTIAA